jgi:hypothetical protein
MVEWTNEQIHSIRPTVSNKNYRLRRIKLQSSRGIPLFSRKFLPIDQQKTPRGQPEVFLSN